MKRNSTCFLLCRGIINCHILGSCTARSLSSICLFATHFTWFCGAFLKKINSSPSTYFFFVACANTVEVRNGLIRLHRAPRRIIVQKADPTIPTTRSWYTPQGVTGYANAATINFAAYSGVRVRQFQQSRLRTRKYKHVASASGEQTRTRSTDHVETSKCGQ